MSQKDLMHLIKIITEKASVTFTKRNKINFISFKMQINNYIIELLCLFYLARWILKIPTNIHF